MNHSLALQGARSQLVRQLIYFDEEKIHFLDQYFPDYNQKRAEVERKLAEYSAWLERLLQAFDEERLHERALIGSRLDVEFDGEGVGESFTIVFPPYADPEQNRVSFLSPVGFQLLMAKAGERCRLLLPSGEAEVEVHSVRYVNRGDVPGGAA